MNNQRNKKGLTKMELSKEFHFEAAHSLPQMPDGHQCKRLHGHSYRFVVTVWGGIDPATGFAAGVDYADLSMFAKSRVIDILDHQNINDFVKPNSTAEYLALWIWRQLITRFPTLYEIAVHETASTVVRCHTQDVEDADEAEKKE